jgi:hypothetical protein
MIQYATSPSIGKMERTVEDERILDTLRQALTYAEEEDGLVPTAHLDYIYDLVAKHIKTGQGKLETENSIGERTKACGNGSSSDTYRLGLRNYTKKTQDSWPNW